MLEVQKNASQLRDEMVGKVYRHFKGSVYKVINIAIDCDDLELVVIYVDYYEPCLVWTRKLTDFLAPVDISKYPAAMQRARFEPM